MFKQNSPDWKRAHRNDAENIGKPALRVALLACTCLGLLVACSPRYDWREVRPEGGGFVALFPDRVHSSARDVRLGSATSLPMRMYMAQVDRVNFAIGIVDLPQAGNGADRDGLNSTAAQTLRAALLDNIKATGVHEMPVKIEHSLKGSAAVAAMAVEAVGRLPDAGGPGPMKGNHTEDDSGIDGARLLHLSARFAVYDSSTMKLPAEASSVRHVIQIVVLGPQAVLARPAGQDVIDTFMTSVKLD